MRKRRLESSHELGLDLTKRSGIVGEGRREIPIFISLLRKDRKIPAHTRDELELEELVRRSEKAGLSPFDKKNPWIRRIRELNILVRATNLLHQLGGDPKRTGSAWKHAKKVAAFQQELDKLHTFRENYRQMYSPEMASSPEELAGKLDARIRDVSESMNESLFFLRKAIDEPLIKSGMNKVLEEYKIDLKKATITQRRYARKIAEYSLQIEKQKEFLNRLSADLLTEDKTGLTPEDVRRLREDINRGISNLEQAIKDQEFFLKKTLQPKKK